MPPKPKDISEIKGRVHAAIITIRLDEYEAMEALLQNSAPVEGGNNSYEYATIKPDDGEPISVVLTRCVGQGNLGASTVANNVISDLDPSWIFLVGIAGGIADNEYSLGDVVLASSLNDFSFGAANSSGTRSYQSGGGPMHRDVERFLATKIGGKNRKRLADLAAFSTKDRFLDHPSVFPGHLDESTAFYGDGEFQDDVRRKLAKRFPEWKRNGGPVIWAGACANGNLLLKSPDLLKTWQESARQIVQVETELSGVYEAARSAGRENYPVLAIRGLSDIVGLKRDSEWTLYACETAAALACAILRSGFIDFSKNLPPVIGGSKAPPIPDNFPTNLLAAHYVDAHQAREEMTDKLRRYRLHIVMGPGGVGKTARVAHATEPLWREGCFPGGRFWIDVYNRGESRTEDVAARAVLRAAGETPDKDVGQQAKGILAAEKNLVLIEGAETIPEDEIAALISIFPRTSKVIWMTRRRDTDYCHDSLQEDATIHQVNPLRPDEALELLCRAARKDRMEIRTGELKVWEDIALETNYLPLLLGWAGKALHPTWHTQPADYLEALRLDPLSTLADPIARKEKNAGRFIRQSLARVTPTREMADLPKIAERLFYTTAAFDSAYGAPWRWLTIAIGLCDRRDPHFQAALRNLESLGMVAVAEVESGDHLIRPFHAHGQAVAGEIWHEQSPSARMESMKMLWKKALLSFELRSPSESSIDHSSIQKRAAEAAHFAHWMQELRGLDTLTLVKDDPSIIEALQSLSEHWEKFLLGEASREPLPRLKETAWLAVCRCRETISTIRPNALTEKFDLARTWANLAEVRRARRDWPDAEEAYRQALNLYTQLTKLEGSPQRSEYRHGLAKAWAGLGAVRRAREEWADAEVAFRESMVLSRVLADEDPHDANYRSLLASCWSDLASMKRAECDLTGSEEASLSALALCDELVERGSDSLKCQRDLLRCWFNLFRLRKDQENWVKAEEACQMVITISERLVSQEPAPENLHRQLVALSFRGDILLERQDFVGAEKAYEKALDAAAALASNHSDMLDFEYALFIAWADLGVARRKGGNYSGSTEALKRALSICQRVADLHPDLPRYENAVAMTFHNLALAYEGQSLSNEAIKSHQRALELRVALAGKCLRLPEFQENVAISWELESDFQAKLRKQSLARVALGKAIAIYEQLTRERPQMKKFQRGLEQARRKLKDAAEENGG